MEQFNYKKEILIWLVLTIPFIYCGYLWNGLPKQIAMHFTVGGTANGWGLKQVIWTDPVMNIAMYIVAWIIVLGLPTPVAEKYGYTIRLLFTAFFTLVFLGFSHMSATQSV